MHRSQGIQQLLQAEKRAAKEVAEDHKQKNWRLKQARAAARLKLNGTARRGRRNELFSPKSFLKVRGFIYEKVVNSYL
uniref:Uncharacterized protein n=1 Tax=Balaenoptera musculus TaxID=9771 RepID=A0A8C0DPX8_BALMU